MSVTFLIPGRQYLGACIFGPVRIFTFIRRERRTGQPAVNIFQCEDFRGMNGPADAGITHLTDYMVRRDITPKPKAKEL